MSRPSTRQSRSRTNGRFNLALVGIAFVGLVLLVWAITRPEPGPRVADVQASAAQAEGYLYGDPNAPVQILEFADFECPACGQFAAVTEPDVRKRILDAGLANLRYFDFPLSQHRNTVPASNAAACAADQGKFWPMHDRLFAGQLEWNGQATDDPKEVFQGYAGAIGLDVAKWEQCYDQQKFISRIMGNRAEAERRHIQQTPTFIIGTKMIPGLVPYDVLKAYVDSAAAQSARQSAARADSQAAPGTKP